MKKTRSNMNSINPEGENEKNVLQMILFILLLKL